MRIGQNHVLRPNHSVLLRLLPNLLPCLVVFLCSFAGPARVAAISDQYVASLRRETEELFYHGYENYMTHAFPDDEVRPITCKPLTRDRANPGHFEVNDALGNYSLTLIDSLSTLAILASSDTKSSAEKALSSFQDGVRDLVEQYGDGSRGEAGQGRKARGFELDSKVQVFETVIRGVGGLLSAHLFAVGDLPIRGYHPGKECIIQGDPSHASQKELKTRPIQWDNGMVYDGQLLRLAYGLGLRLLPAFWTMTGIPYPRVNLRDGIPFYAESPLHLNSTRRRKNAKKSEEKEVTETCSAGAGSLVLEFTVLSRLSGDGRFEDVAKRAFWAIWARRSDIDLLGAGIDAETGGWIHSWTGIGAGIDSFFEYALKSYVLLAGDTLPVRSKRKYRQDPRQLFQPLTVDEHSPSSFLTAWDIAHAAVKRHLHRGPNFQHPHYIQADLMTGASRGLWIDALSAFYPGLLALGGHVEEAVQTHLLHTALWTRFSALPERWSLITGAIEGGLGWWVGRPEFIESNYYIYRATEDPWYLHVAEMTLRDIKRRSWAPCGWASLQNVVTGEQSDRMESFFLGETAKYLYLTFDESHPLNHLDAPFVFSTEGHPLIIPPKRTAAKSKSFTSVQDFEAWGICPVKPDPLPFGYSVTASRGDVYHAASLARLHLMPERESIGALFQGSLSDHPAISVSDLTSPSNYTYYPWTLPPGMVPLTATSQPMVTSPTFELTFPAFSNPGSPAPPLQRVKEGILISFIGGLRLGMVQDTQIYTEDMPQTGYRIQTINGLSLGRDEKVFLAKEMGYGILNPADPLFTRVRDFSMLDIVVDLPDMNQENNTSTPTTENILHEDDTITVEISAEQFTADLDDGKVKSAWNSILSQITGLVQNKVPQAAVISARSPQTTHHLHRPNVRYYLAGAIPTGPGAATLPDWPEPASPSLGFTGSETPNDILQWSNIYHTDELCTHRLPRKIARNKQILIVKRGGCSFSTKMNNIPDFIPTVSSLQLVIVVSYDGHPEQEGPPGDQTRKNTYRNPDENENQLIRPYLDERQTIAGGQPRRYPLPMIMIAGGERTYDALKMARGVGVKRRYSIHTQGVPIVNLIIT